MRRWKTDKDIAFFFCSRHNGRKTISVEIISSTSILFTFDKRSLSLFSSQNIHHISIFFLYLVSIYHSFMSRRPLLPYEDMETGLCLASSLKESIIFLWIISLDFQIHTRHNLQSLYQHTNLFSFAFRWGPVDWPALCFSSPPGHPTPCPSTAARASSSSSRRARWVSSNSSRRRGGSGGRIRASLRVRWGRRRRRGRFRCWSRLT